MGSSDGWWLITYNGEIYNHPELRDSLAGSGVAFRTRSDTEVLLETLVRWGEEGLTRLDGMFAFAAFDESRGRLLLAVDRFGQKPLVWTLLDGGYLAFASELTSLRYHPGVSREWDVLSACRMLSFNSPPAPQTILRGVFRLEPGTALTATLGGDGRVKAHRVFRWWQPRFGDPALSDPSGFVPALRECVRKHLVADVPVGVLLSAGVDSTTVAALAAAERPIVSCSMGFSEGDYDESQGARITARALATDHHEFNFTPGRALAILPTVMSHLDEPLADAGCLPAWELYRQTRAQVSVAIGGDGGDELLEGYPTFAALDFARRLRGLGPLGGWLRAMAEWIPVTDGYYPIGHQARRFLMGLDAEPWYRLQVYTGGCDPRLLRALLLPEVLEQAELRGPPREFARRLYEPAFPPDLQTHAQSLDPRDLAVWLHLRSFLGGEVLRKVDRMSMAHGLEVRAPMLSSPFAERCFAAPSRLRRRGRIGKLPLRRWLAASPLAKASTRAKRGFAIPVARWLRHEFGEIGDALFLDSHSPLIEWCRPGPLRATWMAHRSGRTDARKELWALLTLGLWMTYHHQSPSACS